MLTDGLRSELDRLGAHVVQFAAPGALLGSGDAVTDVDGIYLGWLASAGCEAIVIRPDFYIFGGAPAAAQLPALLDELFAKLGWLRA